MKKLLSIIFLSAIFLSSAALSAQAAAYNFTNDSGINDLGTPAGYNVGDPVTPEYYVGLVLSILFSFVGIIFLVLTIYAGIKWMTAQGNTSQIDSAKETLTKAIVGLVIMMVSYGITFFVINLFKQIPVAN